MNTIELTDEQLERELKARKAARAAAAKREEQAYIAGRDTTIKAIMTEVVAAHEKLKELKQLCHERMETQALKLAEYGKLRSNSKGGFSITTQAGDLRVTRRRDTEPCWDERSEKAMELIKDFLGDTVKKRDQKLYEILISLIARNENNDLEYSEVMNLLKHEDKFTDPRWIEGLKLIRESFSNHLKGYGYEFKVVGADGKWESLSLNFSSL
jgi:hypothetical protein